MPNDRLFDVEKMKIPFSFIIYNYGISSLKVITLAWFLRLVFSYTMYLYRNHSLPKWDFFLLVCLYWQTISLDTNLKHVNRRGNRELTEAA